MAYVLTLPWWIRRRLKPRYPVLLYSLKRGVTQLGEQVNFAFDISEARLICFNGNVGRSFFKTMPDAGFGFAQCIRRNNGNWCCRKYRSGWRPRGFVVRNIGNGVALNVNFTFIYKGEYPHNFPKRKIRYLQNVLAGQKVNMLMPMNSFNGGEFEVLFHYQSIGGRGYESRVIMNAFVLRISASERWYWRIRRGWRNMQRGDGKCECKSLQGTLTDLE
jgi:hypothetical protein